MLEKISEILKNKNILKVMSFTIALLMFLIISETGNPFWKDFFREVKYIENVPINVIYEEEEYFVSGIPNQIPIEISGNENQVTAAEKQKSTFSIQIDLSGRTPGEYTIGNEGMKFNIPSGVDANSAVADLNVDIQERVEKEFIIDLNYVNNNVSNGIIFENPVLSESSVTVVGGNKNIDKIAAIKAFVDLGEITDNKEENKKTLTSKLVAYDKTGNVVNNITFSQETIEVTIGYKFETQSIPVIFEFTGQNTMFVNSICPAGETTECVVNQQINVNAFGSDEGLKELTSAGGVVYTANISNIKGETGTITAFATLPNGVTILDGNMMELNLTLEKGETINQNLLVETTGLASGLSIQAIDELEARVNVEITGSASIIKNFQAQDIKVFIDLSEITGSGTYQIPIQIISRLPIDTKLENQIITINVVGE